MTSAIITGIPAHVSKDSLWKVLSAEHEEQQISFLLYPLGCDKSTAVVCFRTLEALEEMLSVDHKINDTALKIHPLPRQVFKKCTADIDPVTIATIFEGGKTEAVEMLRAEFGVRTEVREGTNIVTISGSMLQLTCAQSRLDTLYREKQWMQQRDLIQNLQMQYNRENEQMMQNADTLGDQSGRDLTSTHSSELRDTVGMSAAHLSTDPRMGTDYTFFEEGDKDDDTHPLGASLRTTDRSQTGVEDWLNYSLPAIHLSDGHPELRKAPGSVPPQNEGMADNLAASMLQEQLHMSLPLTGTQELDRNSMELSSFRSTDALQQSRKLDHKVSATTGRNQQHTSTATDRTVMKPKMMFVMHSNRNNLIDLQNHSSNSDPGDLQSRTSPQHHYSWADSRSNYSDSVNVAGVGGEAATLRFSTPEGVQVSIYGADITTEEVDVIVHSAREDLRLLGSVAQQISDAAGPSLQEQCTTHVVKKGNLTVGEVVAMEGSGSIYSQYVMHAAGPMWCLYPDKHLCATDLKRTYANALQYAADTLYARTVAITAISTGSSGVPVMISAEAAFKAIVQYSSSSKNAAHRIKEIRLVNSDRNVNIMTVKTFQKLLSSIGIHSQTSVPAANDISSQSLPDFYSAQPIVARGANVTEDDMNDQTHLKAVELLEDTLTAAQQHGRDKQLDRSSSYEQEIMCSSNTSSVEVNHSSKMAANFKNLGKRSPTPNSGRASRTNSAEHSARASPVSDAGLITTPKKHSPKIKPPRKNKSTSSNANDSDLMIQGKGLTSARDEAGSRKSSFGNTPRSGRSSRTPTPNSQHMNNGYTADLHMRASDSNSRPTSRAGSRGSDSRTSSRATTPVIRSVPRVYEEESGGAPPEDQQSPRSNIGSDKYRDHHTPVGSGSGTPRRDHHTPVGSTGGTPTRDHHTPVGSTGGTPRRDHHTPVGSGSGTPQGGHHTPVGSNGQTTPTNHRMPVDTSGDTQQGNHYTPVGSGRGTPQSHKSFEDTEHIGDASRSFSRKTDNGTDDNNYTTEGMTAEMSTAGEGMRQSVGQSLDFSADGFNSGRSNFFKPDNVYSSQEDEALYGDTGSALRTSPMLNPTEEEELRDVLKETLDK